MALTDSIGLYTQALNAAFVRAYAQVSDPPPIAMALTEIGSKGRVENYPWLFPPPLMHLWTGYREYAKLGELNYRVPNFKYTCEFEVPLDDLDDDQIGGFKLQAANMAAEAQQYKNIAVQVALAAGQTTPCYDGSNFFASSHNIGTVNNIVTATTAAADAVTHAMVVLVCQNKIVKPLMWQNRIPANFRTDAGTVEAEKVQMVKWFSTMRGAAAFGFPHDAVLCKYANTPTVAEVQTALGTINARFRGFKYPINLPTDVPRYYHGQTEFSKNNVLIVCSTLIEHIVRQALTLSLISATENYFQNWARLCCSGYLDAVT